MGSWGELSRCTDVIFELCDHYITLNSVLLSEADYVNAIKSTIFETTSEYESNEQVYEVLLWIMIKLKIRDASMKYFNVKMKKMKDEEANVESALATLEGQLEQGVNNKDVPEKQIRCKKNELENIIIQYETKVDLNTERAYKWRLSGSARRSQIGILCFDWLIHPGMSYSHEIHTK